MSRRFVFACAVTLAAAVPQGARAQGFEVSVMAGPALPTYKQTFGLKGLTPTVGLVRMVPVQSAKIDAEGGLALAGSATLFLLGPVGIEGRLDSVAVDLKSFAGSYRVESTTGTTLIPSISLGSATAELTRIRPLSLNFKVQGDRRIALGVSAGLSTVGAASVNPTSNLSAGPISVAVPLALEARPSKGRLWGVNLGANMRLKLMDPISVFGEVRGFAFRKSDWTWGVNAQNIPAGVSSQVVSALANALETPSFTPGFWSGTVGVTLSFR